jgi:DMSO/TMAO reductase YedYZ molybdopterin-dependent catalytic subunit
MTTHSFREVAARARTDRPSVLIAVFAGIAGVAGSYATAGYTPAFFLAPIASFLTQIMPDFVIRFAIVTLTDIGQQFGIEHLGQQANLLLAFILGVALLASLTLSALTAGRELDSTRVSIGLTAALVWIGVAVLTKAPVLALGAGIASGTVVAVAALASDPRSGPVPSAGRREVLGSIASAFGVSVFGYVLGSSAIELSANAESKSDIEQRTLADDGKDRNAQRVQELLSEAEEKSLDIENLEGLVSGKDFYEVDIDNVNPVVTVDEWTLPVTGAVEQAHVIDYEQLIEMDSVLRFKTLRCVSDPLNGKNMDNALWRAIPIKDVIEKANPQGEFVMLHATDGYYEEFPVAALETGLLAYAKDGGVLPRQHGHPVRALIPGHWGEIDVKWIDEIEILDRPAKGFWEKKGWHGTGPATTVAKLHATNQLDSGRMQVGGHAYAGTRGIKRVEVSTDGGDSWNEATLSEPLSASIDNDVWRQWMYVYEPPQGEHEVVVRAVDGTGDLQPKTGDDGVYPNGATGWVSKTINS